jgi:hypothetical protein
MSGLASKEFGSFKTEFAKILEQKNIEANVILQQALACLKKHNLLYKLEIECKYFLVHKSNRGGLMLSPFNVHRNAAKIKRAGADMKELRNAVCIELAPCGKLREEQLKANERLVENAKGYLASINGSERYLTVGCGHTAAFCKTAMAGGITPEQELADEQGKIDLRKLCANEQFKHMLEKGWEWQIVPAVVDEAFPKFARIAQKALNANNHTSTEVGELETAVTLAETANDVSGDEDWQEIALDNVKALNVPCAPYSKAILDFVSFYGGGPGAPLVAFMDGFAKQFKAHVNLGEQYWHCMAYTEFPEKTEKFPLIRVAYGLANLVSPKVEDGIARLLGKSDWTKISSKAMLKEAHAMEKVLKEGKEIVEMTSTLQNAVKPLGQIFVRVALHSAGKGDKGPEGRHFTIDEIKSSFLEAMSSLVGARINYDPWQSSVAKAASDAVSKPADSLRSTGAKQPVAFADLSNPEWIAENDGGFKVGSTVHEKGTPTTPTNLFAIFSIDNIVKVQQICSYDGKLQSKEVELAKFIVQWEHSKHAPPIKMASGQLRPTSLDVEAHKARIFQSVVAVSDSCQDPVSKGLVSFWRRPDELRTNGKAIAAGKLTLAPLVNMFGVSTKFGKGSVLVEKHNDINYYLSEPAKQSLNVNELAKLDQWADQEGLVCAFWWVQSTSDKKLANMTYSTISKHGVDIPVLVNEDELPPYTQLLKYVKPENTTTAAAKQTAAKRPLSAAAKKGASKALKK